MKVIIKLYHSNMQQWLFDAGSLDKDLSNNITDDLTTCNNGGLRQKSVQLVCFF